MSVDGDPDRYLKERLDKQDEVLQKILVQALATNGRVTKLETQNAIETALKHQTASVLAKRTARFRWMVPIGAAVGATFGATVLAHLLG